MYAYENLRGNYEVIKEMVRTHRHDLELFSATSIAMILGDNPQGYLKWSSELSTDELCGVYCTALAVDATIELYRRILNGEEFLVVMSEVVSEDFIEKFKELAAL